jgi:hypothetical protein
MRCRYISVLLLLWGLFQPFHGQEFGVITPAEWQVDDLKQVEETFVYLFATGAIMINDDFDLEMDVHKRFMILSEAGKEAANIEIPYWHLDEIRDLQVAIHFADGRTQMIDDDAIYSETISQALKQINIAVPGAAVGAIIEYKYRLYSKSIFELEPWYFQADAITRKSRIAVYIPDGLTYSALPIMCDPYAIEFADERVDDPLSWFGDVRRFTWTAFDVPPFEIEPYTIAADSYRARLQFRFIGFFNDYFRISFTTTWPAIGNNLGRELSRSVEKDTVLAEQVLTIIKASDPPRVKAKKIYSFVQSDIRTLPTDSLPDDVENPLYSDYFRLRQASRSAKKLLLFALLRQAGLEAEILFIRTRSLGPINREWPRQGEFDSFIVKLWVDKKNYYLNPLEKYAPFGLLTEEYDVGEGLLARVDGPGLTGIDYQLPENGYTVKTQAALTSQGDYVATSILHLQGLSALYERKQMDEHGDSVRVREIAANIHQKAIVDSFQVAYRYTQSNSLELHLHYSIPAIGERSDELLYFSLPMFTRETESYFQREERSLPVSFAYAYEDREEIHLRFEEGITCDDVPVKMKQQLKFARFTKAIFQRDNELEIHRRFALEKRTVWPGDYAQLRALMQDILASDSEPVVVIMPQ